MTGKSNVIVRVYNIDNSRPDNGWSDTVEPASVNAMLSSGFLVNIYSIRDKLMHSIQKIMLAVFVAFPAMGLAQKPEKNSQTTPADNSITARIVSTQVIKKRGNTRSSTDLVAFNDRLYLTFLKRWTAGSSESCIRIMSSNDGSAWSTVATIRQRDKNRYLVSRHPGEFRGLRLEDTPRFSVESNNRLSIRAVDAKFNSSEFDTKRMVAWASSKGTDWTYQGALNEVLQWSEMAWNGGKGYAYEYGGACGEGLAMKILATEDGKQMQEIYEYFYFDGSNPDRAGLFFDEANRMGCLAPMYGGGRKTRVEDVKKGNYALAYVGIADPPYDNWTWTKTNMAIWSPRVVSVPSVGLIALAEIRSEPIRTSLCSIDVETGKLTELLSFGNLRPQQLGIDNHEPLGAEHLPIGLAAHKGHVWVSYNRGGAVYLAKIVLEQLSK